MITLRRNVLIFHQAALGDFVLTWPIALAAARLWPTNRTIYVTHPGQGELAERAIGVEWRDANQWSALFLDTPDEARRALPDAAMKSLAGANLILSFASRENERWSNNIRALAPEAQLISISARPIESAEKHLTLFQAEQLQAKPDLQAAVGQMVRHVIAAGALPRRAAPEMIVIHPGSGADKKRWPVDRFVALAQALLAQGHPVTVVIGEAERERFSASDIQSLNNVTMVAAPATLLELFALLGRATLFIGNDTGPTHLAAMMSIPTLALFGADNDVTWRPIGPRVRLLKHDPINELAVDAVLTAAADMLASPDEVAPVADDED